MAKREDELLLWVAVGIGVFLFMRQREHARKELREAERQTEELGRALERSAPAYAPASASPADAARWQPLLDAIGKLEAEVTGAQVGTAEIASAIESGADLTAVFRQLAALAHDLDTELAERGVPPGDPLRAELQTLLAIIAQRVGV